MEDECLCSPLNWEFYHHQEGLEELKHAILQTTLELEEAIVSAKEEITRRECELMEVNDALSKAIKERDESLAQCRKLEQENLQIQQQTLHLQTHNEDGGLKKLKCLSSSSSPDTEASLSSSIISSGFYECEDDDEKKKKRKKALPEKGKLLKAVIAAGPLLQTLLMAGGPLPQWQHPPPLLHSIDIPPFPSSSSSCSLTSYFLPSK
ncbi:uncharacterized protein LOC114712925 [Neltuma alba]|uniref:uncharacterized protein LOC114712925 n=1 Tax=Neltuma alba TaxID=207710 RepID=UPI0010A45E2C|nr:uncharacterized protein LOC114712925 [Prosopis alba]